MAKTFGPSHPSPIVIVGLGSVGRILASKIAQKKIAPLILVGHGKAKEQAFAKSVRATYHNKIESLSIRSGIIWLCVPTSKITETAAELAALDLPWKRICVFHASGSAGADALAPLAKLGAGVAACHPYQTFPKRASKVKIDGILWGLDGNPRGLRAARALTRRLGGVPTVISGPDRAAYHASAVMACTFIAADTEMAFRTLKQLGVPVKQAREAVFSIAFETLRQVQELGIEHALTGPAARGDKALIKKHVTSLKKLDGETAKVYAAISEYILKQTAKGK